MADINFTEEELEEVGRICADLDPATHELTAALLDALESLGLEEEREWALGYFRRAIRSELVMGLMLRAAADGAVLHGATSPKAALSAIDHDYDERYHYKRDQLKAFRAGESEELELDYTTRHSTWQVDFGLLGEIRTLYEVIWTAEERARDRAIPGRELIGDGKSVPAMERFNALLDIAHDRMFGNLEADLELLQSGD